MGDGKPELLELICPVCGALIEAGDMPALIERARAHTLDAHDYDVPAEHIEQTIKNSMQSQ